MGCRVIKMSDMPWSPALGSSHHLAFNGDGCVDFHLWKNVILPTRKITGLNPFNLSAYGLSARYPTLKALCVTTKPPRTRYPVVGPPSGAGFTPARFHDLARPHSRYFHFKCTKQHRYFDLWLFHVLIAFNTQA